MVSLGTSTTGTWRSSVAAAASDPYLAHLSTLRTTDCSTTISTTTGTAAMASWNPLASLACPSASTSLRTADLDASYPSVAVAFASVAWAFAAWAATA